MYEFLDADREWLERQPGMLPWLPGRARIVARIDHWMDEYGAAVGGRVRELGAPLAEECAARLWNCWEYHWRQAAELGEGRADGFEVASRVQAGLGFQGGGRLGGNPFEDVVLAVAVWHRRPEAIERFTDRFRSRAIGVAVKTNRLVREDVNDWWCQLLVHLMGVGDRPGKLQKYAGRCGLWNWLARVARNFSAAGGREPPGDSEEIEQLPARPHDPTEDRDCRELLGGAVRRAIGRLVPEQRTLLYLLFVERLPGKDVAAALGVHPGNISRQKERTVQQLHEALASLDASAVQAQGYRDCLETLTQTRNLRELADVFLTALTELSSAGDDVEQEADA